MKTKTILILALSTAITLTSIAQPPPSPQNAEQINGVVSQYLMNPNGEVDGLLERRFGRHWRLIGIDHRLHHRRSLDGKGLIENATTLVHCPN